MQNVKVGYLGPGGSYSEEVALTIKADEYLLFATIPRLLQAFWKGEVEKIVLPIENSIEGIVTPSIDNLIVNCNGNNFVIEGEFVLQIKHCLAGIGNEDDIRQIISHPQALAQCSKFIDAIGAQTEDVNSTSRAAETVAKKQDFSLGAICSIKAATIYGLKVFREDIQDYYNETRFIILGHEAKNQTWNDKTTLVFQLKNKPGALVRVLEIFDVLDINMIQIISRPSKIKLGQYVFLAEIEGHQNEKEVSVALQQVKKRTGFLKVLGSYPKYKTEEEKS